MKKTIKKAGKHVKKHVVGTHKPHKPFLKRHVTLLTVSLIAVAALLIQIVVNAVYFSRLQDQARQIVEQNSNVNSAANIINVRSTLGFSADVDVSKFNVRASVIAQDGSLETFTGQNATEQQAYSIVQITPGANAPASATANRLNILTTTDGNGVDLNSDVTNDNLQKVAETFAESTNSAFDVTKTSTTTREINGQTFLVERFVSVPKYTSRGNLAFSDVGTTVWTTYANGRAYSLKLTGVPASVVSESFDSIIESFRVSTPSERNTTYKLQETINDVAMRQPLVYEEFVDTLLGTQDVHAQASEVSDSSRIVADNAAGVVKIISVTCGTINYLNQPLLTGCDGGTGTGFTVSGDGYIGTNGHVVDRSPQDMIFNSILRGPAVLQRILQIEGYTQGEINEIIQQLAQNPNLIVSAAASIYDVDESVSTFSSDTKHNHVVIYGSESPEFEVDSNDFLLPVTETDGIKNAELIDSNFSSKDLLSAEFTSSDVALLKVEGENYPTVSLGTIEEATSGSALTVIGFPGTSENVIVDTSVVEPTATQGVVSAVRDTSDGEYKVIQSDVAISRGNSGGPAFASNGKVVGIATYNYGSEAGSSDATISYMRDVADLKQLTDTNGAEISESETQKKWNEGVELFYKARFTPAIKKFEEAKQLFPGHRLADSYIDLANVKIANGEEVSDPNTIIYLSAGAVIAVGGVVGATHLIANQRKRHGAFKAGEIPHPQAQLNPHPSVAPQQNLNASPVPPQTYAPQPNPQAQQPPQQINPQVTTQNQQQPPQGPPPTPSA